MTVYEDETIEDLQINGFQLIQKKTGFRFGMDAVLLADFASIRKNDLVADFGTGSGILPVLLIARGKGEHFKAIEIQKDLALLAERNISLNGLNNRVEVIHQDACNANQYIDKCSLDAVVCNPPYWQPCASLTSPDSSRAVARNQSENLIDNLFKSAFNILKGKGKFFMIYPAAQMLEVMKQLQRMHLEPKRFRLVYSRVDKPANLVLIEAVKDAKSMLHSLPPLIIYNSDGCLTNELKSVYHINDYA